VESSIRLVAEWYVLRGRPEIAFFDAPGAAAPSPVQSAYDSLKGISAAELLSDRPRCSAAEKVHALIHGLDNRAIAILRLRSFADSPKTLEEVSSQFGVTRERIRQIETRTIIGLRASAEIIEAAPLGASGLIEQRHVAPIEAVLGETPSLGESVPAVGQPLWRVLDRLDDSFQVKDGWWCQPTVRSAIDQTKAGLFHLAAGRRAIRIEEMAAFTDRPWAEEWIRYCGIAVHEGYALLASAGVPDRAAVVLEIEGSPLSVEDIIERMGGGRTEGTVRNALAADERFDRVDRRSWALRSWGLHAYESIRTLISNELNLNDGSIRLSKLVATLTDRFSITGSSVVTYAAARPFATADGIVEFATTSEIVPRKSAFETRRLFRINDGWALRIQISTDHARGSGSVLPSALITELGIRFGESPVLRSRMGDQRIAWNGSQLTLGSVKRFVDADGMSVGDVCFAVFRDDGSFDLGRTEIPAGLGRQRALALAGLTMAGSDSGFLELAGSIGLPPGVSPPQVAERLRVRGDYDIAECVLVQSW